MAENNPRKQTKAQAMKDAWISETQSFQRIARSSDECDSYEELAKVYDEELSNPSAKRKKKKIDG